LRLVKQGKKRNILTKNGDKLRRDIMEFNVLSFSKEDAIAYAKRNKRSDQVYMGRLRARRNSLIEKWEYKGPTITLVKG